MSRLSGHIAWSIVTCVLGACGGSPEKSEEGEGTSGDSLGGAPASGDEATGGDAGAEDMSLGTGGGGAVGTGGMQEEELIRVEVNFDELAAGTAVTSAYEPHVTFLSGEGDTLQVVSDPAHALSDPNFACSFGVSSPCAGDIILDFPKAAYDVSFMVVGVESEGTVGVISLDTAGGLPPGNMVVQRAGNYTEVPFALFVESGITQIRIKEITDVNGFGLDDLVFFVRP